eukprot:3532306-Ditylum_brightwellii.AAC.1
MARWQWRWKYSISKGNRGTPRARRVSRPPNWNKSPIRTCHEAWNTGKPLGTTSMPCRPTFHQSRTEPIQFRTKSSSPVQGDV